MLPAGLHENDEGGGLTLPPGDFYAYANRGYSFHHQVMTTLTTILSLQIVDRGTVLLHAYLCCVFMHVCVYLMYLSLFVVKQ